MKMFLRSPPIFHHHSKPRSHKQKLVITTLERGDLKIILIRVFPRRVFMRSRESTSKFSFVWNPSHLSGWIVRSEFERENISQQSWKNQYQSMMPLPFHVRTKGKAASSCTWVIRRQERNLFRCLCAFVISRRLEAAYGAVIIARHFHTQKLITRNSCLMSRQNATQGGNDVQSVSSLITSTSQIRHCVGFRATATELEIPISNNNHKSTPASSLKICRLGEYLTWNNVSVFFSFSLQLEVPLIRFVIYRTEIAQWRPPGPSRLIDSPKGGKKEIVHEADAATCRRDRKYQKCFCRLLPGKSQP